MTSVYKDIPGFKGYSISEDGAIRGKYKTLTPFPHKHGYLQVHLYTTEGRKCKLVHRLVAETFIPNPENLPEVNHKDGNKQNNHKSNLEWCTKPYNVQHAYDNKLGGDKRGVKNGRAKLNEEKVKAIKKVLTSDTKVNQAELARKYGVNKIQITHIKQGKTWSHVQI
tara:strand:+ start:771 stop:1271 length:501 start_codon:yes stop_codon:yes gene_type:complete